MLSGVIVSRERAAQSLREADFAWIEITDLSYRDSDGQWALGRRLWSPSQYEGGADRYSGMREIQAGDLVLHWVKKASDGDRVLIGFSQAAGSYLERIEEPPNAGRHSGRPSYYIVDLVNFQQVDEPLPLGEFIDSNKQSILRLADENDHKAGFPFQIRNDGVRVDQRYLGKASKKLLNLLADSLSGNKPLTTDTGEDSKILHKNLWRRSHENALRN